MGFMLVRSILVLACAWIGFAVPPVGLPPNNGLVIGLAFAAASIALEVKLRRLSPNVLLGGVLGGGTGLLLAFGLFAVLSQLALPPEALGLLRLASLMALVYLGTIVGAKKGEWITPRSLKALFSEGVSEDRFKILDTSVIIDGRIAEVCETGFIEGTLVVPLFILRELQAIADSADSLKRNRGRRGLDILQRLQKTPNLTVQISETDFPSILEVDLKLIELAKQLDSKIITNDANLNKVARLRGVPALNINELASSLRPVVLPGECMSVYLVKHGKEPGQGVGYLDDGTMVVVDSAAERIDETVNIQVTSVLQTTAGKMIFGRIEALVEERHVTVEAGH